MKKVAIAILLYLIFESQQLTEAKLTRSKRAIFREQLNPERGGKIPETAFNTDRLILNRLQAEGIAIPDGIVLEQRHNKVYPFPERGARQTYKVKLESFGHYLASPYADSTYLVKTAWYGAPKLHPPFKAIPVYFGLPGNMVQKPKTLLSHNIQRPLPQSQFVGQQYLPVPVKNEATSYFSFNSYHKPAQEAWLPLSKTTTSDWTSGGVVKNDFVEEHIQRDLDEFFSKFGSQVLRDSIK